MALAPQFDQLVIDNGSKNFKETVFFEPDLFTEREYCRFLLSIEVPGSPDGSKKLTNILKKTVQANLYNDLGNSPYESLEATLQVANEEVAKLEESVGEWVWDTNIVVAIFSQEELHISVSGRGEVYLVRSGQIVNVAEGLAEGNNRAEKKLFLSIASGQLQKHDICLASTSNLSRFIKPKQLATVIKDSRTTKEVVGALVKQLELPSKQLLNLAVIMMSTAEELGAQMAELTTIAHKGKNQFKKLLSKAISWLKKHEVGKMPKGPDLDKEVSEELAQKKQSIAHSLSSFKHRLKKTLYIIRSKRSLKDTAHSLGMTLPQQKKQRKALIITAVICVLILLGAIGAINKNKRAHNEELAVVFEDMLADRQAAETRRLFDKEGAKHLLSNAAKLAAQLEEADYRSFEVSGELAKINLILDDISDISRVRSIKVYNDLKKEVSKPSPHGMLYQDNNIYVYENRHIYKVLIDKIESYPLLATDEEIIAATTFKYNKSFLFLTSAGKLYEFKNNTVKEIVHPGGGSWPTAQAITEYSESRNIYLLDAANNEIWSYRATADGFSSPARKNTVKSDIKDAHGMVVDGNIYILKSNGEVIKTYGGSPRTFALKNLPDGLGSATKILTNIAQDHVYFLFPQGRSIVKTDKRGLYIKQYLIEDADFAIPIDCQVSESLGKIFVVDSGGKIIEIQI